MAGFVEVAASSEEQLVSAVADVRAVGKGLPSMPIIDRLLAVVRLVIEAPNANDAAILRSSYDIWYAARARDHFTCHGGLKGFSPLGDGRPLNIAPRDAQEQVRGDRECNGAISVQSPRGGGADGDAPAGGMVRENEGLGELSTQI